MLFSLDTFKRLCCGTMLASHIGVMVWKLAVPPQVQISANEWESNRIWCKNFGSCHLYGRSGISTRLFLIQLRSGQCDYLGNHRWKTSPSLAHSLSLSLSIPPFIDVVLHFKYISKMISPFKLELMFLFL